MKRVLLIYKDNISEEEKEVLDRIIYSEIWREFEFERIELLDNKNVVEVQNKIINSNAEMIVSINMAGFQYKTLLENYLYNILPVKQLHIIMDESIWCEHKEADFAMNLFLYIEDEGRTCIEEESEQPNIRYYPKRKIEAVIDDFVRVSKI